LHLLIKSHPCFQQLFPIVVHKPMLNVRHAAVLLAGFLTLLGVEQGAAQSPDTIPPVQPLEQTGAPRPILERSIDRAQYRLGPGDVLTVALFGDLNRHHSVVVAPEGGVLVPAIGVVNVLGLSLDEAQRRVQREVLRLYRNVDVNVSLAELRSFRVYLLGSVPSPGLRIANPTTRISEIVPAAQGDTIRRNLSLRRATGDTLSVDLLPFVAYGDLGSNPTLHAGDVVVAPPIRETISVHGRVALPGTYEYRAGESLAGFLEIVNGRSGFPADAADSLRVTRSRGRASREVFVFALGDAAGATGRQFQLHPFDAVFVPVIGDFGRVPMAVVEGQVERPGVYPIEPNRTTVRELVQLAGGFLPDASLAGATLRRSPPGLAADPLRGVPLEALSPEERRIAQVRTQGGESNVVVDFRQLFLEGAQGFDQPVLSGDVISVPRRRDEVLILGAVARPGIVAHRPGQSAEHYLRLAGGLSSRADRGNIAVLRSHTGTELALRDVEVIEAGDHIVIPFRPHRTAMERLQMLSYVASTVSGIVVLALSFARLF
jgi:polysaccharide biosynthesis/export protein